MLIDSDELIKYFESACNICKDKGTKYCDRYCFVGDVVDMINSFIEHKKGSAKYKGGNKMYIYVSIDIGNGYFETKAEISDEELVKMIDRYFEVKGIKIQETGII